MLRKELDKKIAAKKLKHVTDPDEKVHKDNREYDESVSIWETYGKEGSMKLACVTRTSKMDERPYDSRFFD